MLCTHQLHTQLSAYSGGPDHISKVVAGKQPVSSCFSDYFMRTPPRLTMTTRTLFATFVLLQTLHTTRTIMDKDPCVVSRIQLGALQI